MIKTEKHLYKHIQNWLRREGYKVDKSWQNRGGDKYRVDVIGIRSSGTEYCDDIEIVAIEAKLWGNYQTLGQAENYKDIAHKVYFATASEDIAERHKDGCAEKNLGLLYINRKTERVAEVLSAPVSRPKSEAKMMEFLRKLYIGRCSICKCYFDLWEEWDDTKWLSRSAEFGKVKTNVNIYMCKKCYEMLYQMVDKPVRKLNWRCDRIDNWHYERTNKLEKRYDKWCAWIESQYKEKIKKLDRYYYGWCKAIEKYYDNEIKELKK